MNIQRKNLFSLEDYPCNRKANHSKLSMGIDSGNPKLTGINKNRETGDKDS